MADEQNEQFEEIVAPLGEQNCTHEGPCAPPREVFGFDPDDPEQYAQVVEWTVDMFEAACRNDCTTSEELARQIFGTGPEGLFISFTTLAATAQVAVAKAFGDDVTDATQSRWTMDPGFGLDEEADEETVEAHMFAGAFITAYMNDDSHGAMEMFKAKLTGEFQAVVNAHTAMLMQSQFLLMTAAKGNPEAFADVFTFVDELGDEIDPRG